MSNNTENQINEFQDTDLVSFGDAAKFIRMSKSFLKTVKTQNRIPFYQIGSSIKFKIADLKAFMESCRIDNEQKGTVDDASCE
jgi:excisionase family DNA binding protein